jgi:flagellar hook-length control protein FliK
MSQTNIDYLFQLTAAGATSVPGDGARHSDRLPAFDDHLSRASATTRDKSSKMPGQEEPPRQRLSHWTNDRPSQQSPEGPPQQRSSDSTEAPAGNDNRRADTSSESNNADADSGVDRSHDASSTEQPTENDEDSSSHDERGEAPNATEPSAAAAVSTATLNTLVAEVASAANASSAEPPAATSTISGGENPTGKQAAHVSAASDERAVKLVADETAVDVAAAYEATEAEQPTSADKATKSAASVKSRKSADAEIVSRVVTGGESEQSEARSALRGAAATAPSADIQATIAIEEAGQPDEELTADRATDDAKTRADEPPRRAAAGSMSVATVTNGATPQASETRTTADAKDVTHHSAKLAAPKGEALANMLSRPQPGSSTGPLARRTAGEEDLPRIDPGRFIGRVAKAFQTAAERGGTLQLRLSPPELGSLRLELTVKEGAMTAVLETETTAARRVLLDHLPALRDRLAEQNIRIERFDVDVRREGSGSQADGRAAQHEQQHQPDQSQPRRPPSTQARIEEPAPREAAALQNRANNTQINLLA